MSGLRDATIEALDQIRSVILAIEAASGPSGNLYAATGIGPHVRHVLDHFRAFQAGIKSGTVNYNKRRRECALERRSDLALLEIESLVTWLQAVTATAIAVTVESEISCLQTENARFQSNTNRELLYLINHTIHHAAYAALLVRQHGVIPDAGVGYAPATASYLRDGDAKPDESRSRHITDPSQPCRGLAT